MTLDLVLATSLLLVCASAAARLMTRASAASRHLVWTAALLAIVAMPAARALLPAIEVPVLSPSRAGTVQPQTAIAFNLTTDLQPGDAPPVLPVTTARTITFSHVAGALWLAGIAAILLWYVAGTVGVWRLSRRSTPGPADLQQRAVRHALASRVVRNVRVRIAGDDRVPMTWGLLRPTILLPAGWTDWPADRLDSVLAHELAHAARFDVAAHRVARIAAALYWFNPLVWFALRQAQLERERACDDLVLTRGSLASTYAGELIAFARALSAPAAVLPMARRSRLEARVMAILDPRTNRKGISAVVAVFAAVLITATVIASTIKLTAYDFPAPPSRETFVAERPAPSTQFMTFSQKMPPPPPPAPAGKTLPPPPPPPPAQLAQTPPPPLPPPPAAPRLVTPEAARTARCDRERAQAATDGWDLSGLHLPCEPGVESPVRIREAKPAYTPEAMRAKIEGTVTLAAVIDADGVIREAKVTRSLDRVFGLDDQALKAVRVMKFLPAKLNGEPTRALVTFELQFTLR